MNLDRITAFVDMGDDALYVWAAIAMVIAALALELVSLWLLRRRAREGHGRRSRDDSEPASTLP
jgi:heme exporter protein D